MSIQAEVINLLKELQEWLGVSYLFIAHDLSVVAHISARVAVLYVGRLMELAATENIFFSPKHPYTRALMSAVPTINTEKEFAPIVLQGEIPNPANPPAGCRFHTRCPYADTRCQQDILEWREIEPEHFVACHYAHQLDL